MKRVIPIILLLQGLSPIVSDMLRLHRVHEFYFMTATVYSLIALWLWSSSRWALVVATLITLPQIVTISSPSFVWHFLVGPTAGLFFTLPLSQLEYGAYWHISAFFYGGIRVPTTLLQREYSIDADTFVLLNIYCVFLSALLLTQLRRVNRQAVKSAQGC